MIQTVLNALRGSAFTRRVLRETRGRKIAYASTSSVQGSPSIAQPKPTFKRFLKVLSGTESTSTAVGSSSDKVTGLLTISN